MPGNAASGFVPFQQQIPGGRWVNAASILHDESGPYSISEKKPDDSRDAERTQDDEERSLHAHAGLGYGVLDTAMVETAAYVLRREPGLPTTAGPVCEGSETGC